MLIRSRNEAAEWLRNHSEADAREAFIDYERRVRNKGINIMKNKGKPADWICIQTDRS